MRGCRGGRPRGRQVSPDAAALHALHGAGPGAGEQRQAAVAGPALGVGGQVGLDLYAGVYGVVGWVEGGSGGE